MPDTEDFDDDVYNGIWGDDPNYGQQIYEALYWDELSNTYVNAGTRWPWESNPDNPEAWPECGIRVFFFRITEGWTAQEWQNWYVSMQQKYGTSIAQQRFVTAAQAYADSKARPLPREFYVSPEFHAWLQSRGLLGSVIDANAADRVALGVNTLANDTPRLIKKGFTILEWSLLGLGGVTAALYLYPQYKKDRDLSRKKAPAK